MKTLAAAAIVLAAVLFPVIAGGVLRGEAAPKKKSAAAETAAPSRKPPSPYEEHVVPKSPRGKVIAAHTAEAPRAGEGSFLLLNDGTLIYVYGSFTGMGDTSRSRIGIVRSRDNGDAWSAPQILFEDPEVSLLHPSLVRLPGGGVGLAYSRLWGATKAAKFFRYSKDEGKTWSAEVPVSDGSFGYMTGAHDRLIRVGRQRIINTVHAKIVIKGSSRQLGTFIFASDDDGLTWHNKTPRPLTTTANPSNLPESGFLETSIVELDGGELYMVGRTTSGWLYESRSKDAGDTWSEPAQSPLANPAAPARLTRIPGTSTVVVLRNAGVDLSGGAWHGGARLVLSTQTSDDGGRTWGHYRELEHSLDGTWYDYPSVYWVGDMLHVAYRSISQSPRFSDVRYQRVPKAWLTEDASTVEAGKPAPETP